LALTGGLEEQRASLELGFGARSVHGSASRICQRPIFGATIFISIVKRCGSMSRFAMALSMECSESDASRRQSAAWLPVTFRDEAPRWTDLSRSGLSRGMSAERNQ